MYKDIHWNVVFKKPETKNTWYGQSSSYTFLDEYNEYTKQWNSTMYAPITWGFHRPVYNKSFYFLTEDGICEV